MEIRLRSVVLESSSSVLELQRGRMRHSAPCTIKSHSFSSETSEMKISHKQLFRKYVIWW